MMPFFSIIIPVYNVALYLRECLDSVLAQTFTDWEAICVDDGSTDGSGAILDEYAAKDKRIRVIHQPNAGVSAARNTALDLARGQYVGFIDGDDVVLPEWMAQAYRILKTNRVDVLRMQFTYWNGAGLPQAVPRQKVSFCVNKDIDDLQNKYVCVILMGGWSWLLFISRQIISASKARFPVGMRMHEDVIFELYLTRFLTSICRCNYAGYLYRQVKTSSTKVQACNQDCIRYINEIRDVYYSLRVSEEISQAFSYSIASSVDHWYRARETGYAGKIALCEVVKCCSKAYKEKLIRIKGLPLEFKVQQCGIIFFKTNLGFEIVRIAKGINRRISWLLRK